MAYASPDASHSHKPLFRLGDSVGERVADTIERVANGVRETLHRGDCTETYQSRDKCVFNQVLTGIVRDKRFCKVLHWVVFFRG